MKTKTKKVILIVAIVFIIYSILIYIFPQNKRATTISPDIIEALEKLAEFPGCDDCNNVTDYLIWLDEHPNYKPVR